MCFPFARSSTRSPSVNRGRSRLTPSPKHTDTRSRSRSGSSSGSSAEAPYRESTAAGLSSAERDCIRGVTLSVVAYDRTTGDALDGMRCRLGKDGDDAPLSLQSHPLSLLVIPDDGFVSFSAIPSLPYQDNESGAVCMALELLYHAVEPEVVDRYASKASTAADLLSMFDDLTRDGWGRCTLVLSDRRTGKMHTGPAASFVPLFSPKAWTRLVPLTDVKAMLSDDHEFVQRAHNLSRGHQVGCTVSISYTP